MFHGGIGERTRYADSVYLISKTDMLYCLTALIAKQEIQALHFVKGYRRNRSARRKQDRKEGAACSRRE